MQYILAVITNNSLGKVVFADSHQHALEMLEEWTKKSYNRGLTEEEREDGEVTSYDEAGDTTITFAIGIIGE